MITIYVGEQRNGRVKFASDRDCLAPDVIRFTERVFPSMEDVKTAAARFEDRGFRVCIDTDDCFYETPADFFKRDLGASKRETSVKPHVATVLP